MAREVIVRMTDDLDRSKLADETRDITFEGVIYTLDLTSENLEKLRKALRPWLEAAHEKTKLGQKKKASPAPTAPHVMSALDKEERERVRSWGRQNGFSVGEKGMIAKDVIDAYRSAQNGVKA